MSIQDVNQDSSTLIVYPNPTNGILNIKKDSDPKKIEVFDLTGAVVYNGKFTSKIDLSFLSKGVYFVKTDLNQIVKVVVE